MTKTERIQEATRLFYEICDNNGFIAEDEGFGSWTVFQKGEARSDQMFQVGRRKFDVCTTFCECEKALQFARKLEVEMENVKRMMEL